MTNDDDGEFLFNLLSGLYMLFRRIVVLSLILSFLSLLALGIWAFHFFMNWI